MFYVYGLTSSTSFDCVFAPSASRACTVRRKVPGRFGVPVNAPRAFENRMPGGSFPLAFHVTGRTPPAVASRAW